MDSAAADDPIETGATVHSIVMTTVDSQAAAEALAAGIVEARLAACVQIVAIASVYRWQGQVRRDGEWLLLIKGGGPGRAHFERLERFIRPIHPYQTPELVQVPITGGSADYLRWLDEASNG